MVTTQSTYVLAFPLKYPLEVFFFVVLEIVVWLFFSNDDRLGPKTAPRGASRNTAAKHSNSKLTN